MRGVVGAGGEKPPATRLRLAGAVNGIPGWDDQIDTRYPILTFGYHGLEPHRHL